MYIFKRMWRDFNKYRYLLFLMVKKDFTRRYRRSALGVLWSVLNPLGMMVVMSIIFSRIFRIDVENYPIYYLSGSLMFNFMSEATTGAMKSIIQNAPLLKQIYIPKYILPLERCLFTLVNIVFVFVAMLIMSIILGVYPTLYMLLAPLPILYVLMFCVGFGMVLASVTVFFRDVEHIYGVIVSAWMFMTPIMYPIDALPEKIAFAINFNPMYHYVNMFRAFTFYGTMPDLKTMLICPLISVGFLIFGAVVLRARQDKFILYI